MRVRNPANPSISSGMGPRFRPNLKGTPRASSADQGRAGPYRELTRGRPGSGDDRSPALARGDPTEGRRFRERAAGEEPQAPGAGPPHGRGRFARRWPARCVAAPVLGGAAGLGLLGGGDAAPAAALRSSVSVGAKQQGDVAAIYKAASPAVVSVRTGGVGTGFVVDTAGLLSRTPTWSAMPTGCRTSSPTTRPRRQPCAASTRPQLLFCRSTRRARASSTRSSWPTPPPCARVSSRSPSARRSACRRPRPAGIVSGTGRHIQAPHGFQIDSVIQTDAPINRATGRPLLDANGRVIGVNSQIATGGSGGGQRRHRLRRPANTVRDVIPRLERGETIRRAYLGVSTTAAQGGAVVREATSAAAAEAGVRAGDRIVAIGGKDVRTPDEWPRGSRTAAQATGSRSRSSATARGRRSRSSCARGRSRRHERAKQAWRGIGGADSLASSLREHREEVVLWFQAPLSWLGLALFRRWSSPTCWASGGAAVARRRSRRPRWRRRPCRGGRGWRRHAPLLLAALAVAGLIAALARPQISVAVPAERAAIVLAMDHSGSMQATDVAPSRLVAARAAGEAFLDKVPERVRVGGVVFDDSAEAVQSPTVDRARLQGRAAGGDEAQRRHGHGRGPGHVAGDAARPGRCRRQAAAGRDRAALRRQGHARPRSRCRSPTRPSASGWPVYTVALGTPSGTLPNGEAVPPDTATLRAIAERSGGRAFAAQEAEALSAVYERLGSQVATKREQREVTGAFAGRRDRAPARGLRPVPALVPAPGLRRA